VIPGVPHADLLLPTGFDLVLPDLTDVPATKRFWTDVMGFMLVMEVSDCCLFLVPASLTAIGVKDHEGTAAGTFDERRPGLDHLALWVPDVGELAAWAEHLSAHNVEYSEIEEPTSATTSTFERPRGSRSSCLCSRPKRWLASQPGPPNPPNDQRKRRRFNARSEHRTAAPRYGVLC